MWVTLSLRKKELKQEHAYYQLQDLQISRTKRQLDRRKRYEQSLIKSSEKQALAPLKESYENKVETLNKSQTALRAYLNAVRMIKNQSESYVIDGNNKNQVYVKKEGGKYVNDYDGSNSFYNVDNLYKDNEGNYYKDSALEDGLTLESGNNGSEQRYDLAYDLSQYQSILDGLGYETNLTKFDTSTDIASLESRISGDITALQTELQTARTDYMGDESATKAIWEDELEMLEEEVGDEETQLELEQNDIETQMEYVSNEMQAIGDSVSNQIQQGVIKLA